MRLGEFNRNFAAPAPPAPQTETGGNGGQLPPRRPPATGTPTPPSRP